MTTTNGARNTTVQAAYAAAQDAYQAAKEQHGYGSVAAETAMSVQIAAHRAVLMADYEAEIASGDELVATHGATSYRGKRAAEWTASARRNLARLAEAEACSRQAKAMILVQRCG